MHEIIQNLPKNHYFDYTYLLDLLQVYKQPRDKITDLLKSGEIIRIKKGLYVIGERFGGSIDKEVLANAIYGPSCISLDYALSYYSMIPERVVEITSVTPNRNKKYTTGVGSFSYSHVRKETFDAGIVYKESGITGFLIASPEKALFDKVLLEPGLRTKHEIEEYVTVNLRIEKESLVNFSNVTIKDLTTKYNYVKTTLLSEWIKKLKIED
jgi:hypothetical protein